MLLQLLFFFLSFAQEYREVPTYFPFTDFCLTFDLLSCQLSENSSFSNELVKCLDAILKTEQ